MTLYERMARWSKVFAVFLVTLVAIAGCNREVSKSTRDREHSIADGMATETLGDPWAEGEDCRNWGCAEKSAASQSVVAPVGDATTCTSPGQCPSGFCVDGVCCDKACTGTCLACTAAKKGSGADGVCGAIALYGDPDNECLDAACSGAGTCQSYNGVVCSAGAQCLSGNCADGYCCGGACTETCRACSKAKTGGAYNGQCLSIPGGSDPDNECAFGDCNGSAACSTPVNQPNGVACTAAGQCASGYCVDGVCCGAACTETCRACTVAKRGGGYDGQCGSIAIGTDPDNECVNGECNGSAACTTPIGQSNGSACSSSAQCTSGFCADGVCCDKACTGTCEACTATKKGSGSNGVCGFIAANANPDNECVGGKCGGAGTCKYYNGIACASTSNCLSGYCVDGVCCGGACTGTCQACSVAKKGGGIEGQCGNIATGTDPEAECASDCNGSGACMTLLANGSACMVGTLCTSGFCADGVCCDKACSGTCEACTSTKKGSGSNGVCGFVAADTNPDNECVGGKCGGSGTCKSYNGLACASTSNCLSGYCVDGVCCGGACTGTCQACSVAKKGGGIEGQCGNIATATDPDSECGGDCNGAGACTLGGIGASCNGGAQCSSGFCVDGVCCNSACTGTCQACTAAKKGSGTNGTCGNIASASDPDNECAGTCNGMGSCAAPPVLLANGAQCNASFQCASGYCIDGFCCNTSCYETCKACNVPGFEGTCSETSPGACSLCSGILGLPAIPNSRPGGSNVATADLNADGYVDVATTFYTNGTFGVLLGNGNGTFSPNGDYATGVEPIAVALADVNGDGTIDAVVTNKGDVNVSVLLNQGDGTFVSAGNHVVGGEPTGIALADIDGDGNIDIAAANYGLYPNSPQSVSVLLGDGLGAFAPKIDSVFPGIYPRSIAAADFTGDGMADLAVTHSVSSNSYVSVLRSVGNGSVQFLGDYPLTNPSQFEETYSVHHVVPTDMNGDGIPDLVAATEISPTYGKLLVLLNQGNGTFVDQYHSSMEGMPAGINTGDLNGDGLVDVAIAGSDRVFGATIFLNNGAGAYTKTLYRGTNLGSLAIDDLNGDGAMDLVGGMGYGITVLLNRGSGTFLDDAATSDAIQMADLDGNGTLDAVVQRNGYNDNVVSVHLNQGSGTFASRVDLGTSTSWAQAFTVADLNGDGKPDIAITNPLLDTVSVRLNNGNGTFGAATQYTVGSTPGYILAADVTGDGKRDLAVANFYGSSISILRNNGNGTFAAKADYPTSQSPSKIVAADMNDDGMTDFVIGSNFNAKIEVAINQGNSTFVVSNFGIDYADYVVTDMNSDGKPDFVTTNSTNAISVRLNQGSGTFGAEVLYPVVGMAYAILYVQDMDGNGTLDVRMRTGFPARTSILFNRGAGTFGTQVDYPTPSMTFADINGDGLLDGIRADAVGVFVKYGECLP